MLVAGGVVFSAKTGWDIREEYAAGELGATLELRRVAQFGDPGLSSLDVQRSVLITGEKLAGYCWVEAGARMEFDWFEAVPIYRYEEDQLYILVADESPYAMTHDAGPNEWGLKWVDTVAPARSVASTKSLTPASSSWPDESASTVAT